MTFEAFNKYGHRVLHTYQVSCIPFNDIEDMSKAGYKFKVDGKVVAKNRIKEVVEQSIGSKVELSKSNDTSSDADIVYSRQIRCIDNGKIYKNQSEAAKDLGIDPAQVSDSIKTGRPRSGYTFERVPLSEVA